LPLSSNLIDNFLRHNGIDCASFEIMGFVNFSKIRVLGDCVGSIFFAAVVVVVVVDFPMFAQGLATGWVVGEE